MHYSPVRHWSCDPFDLHVLGTPPAFVLSQDQTLKFVLTCYLISVPGKTCVLRFTRTLLLSHSLFKNPRAVHSADRSSTQGPNRSQALLEAFLLFFSSLGHQVLRTLVASG